MKLYWAKSPSGDWWLYDKPSALLRFHVASLHKSKDGSFTFSEQVNGVRIGLHVGRMPSIRRHAEIALNRRSIILFGVDHLWFEVEKWRQS